LRRIAGVNPPLTVSVERNRGANLGGRQRWKDLRYEDVARKSIDSDRFMFVNADDQVSDVRRKS
jgi:hypothetical protein